MIQTSARVFLVTKNDYTEKCSQFVFTETGKLIDLQASSHGKQCSVQSRSVNFNRLQVSRLLYVPCYLDFHSDICIIAAACPGVGISIIEVIEQLCYYIFFVEKMLESVKTLCSFHILPLICCNWLQHG